MIHFTFSNFSFKRDIFLSEIESDSLLEFVDNENAPCIVSHLKGRFSAAFPVGATKKTFDFSLS